MKAGSFKLLKVISIFFILVMTSVMAVTAHAKEDKWSDEENESQYSARYHSKYDGKVIRIEVGEESGRSEDKLTKRDLERRIYRLEKAVRQLQERVFDLEVENDSYKNGKPEKKMYTCFIKTSFKGTFSATRSSLTQAKAEAMEKCSDVIKAGFDCDEEKVKCGE